MRYGLVPYGILEAALEAIVDLCLEKNVAGVVAVGFQSTTHQLGVTHLATQTIGELTTSEGSSGVEGINLLGYALQAIAEMVRTGTAPNPVGQHYLCETTAPIGATVIANGVHLYVAFAAAVETPLQQSIADTGLQHALQLLYANIVA